MSVRLYVGNLPKELDRKELQAVFAEEGDTISAKVITDRKTGKCRGFGFVTVQSDDLADQIVEKYNGFMFGENALKIERAQPRKKNKPESEEGRSSDGGEATATATPGVVAANQSPTSSPSSAPTKSGGGKKKKSNRNQQGSANANSSSTPDSIQPDPRWANELEKLKQMLSAQA
ncbi:MAG: RNA-binding protein [Limnospira sp. PMC 1291.21]|uniref:Glycine-rich RNA-binding protein, rbp-like n=2 Tax=Limnospira TaxID=2596745 RepID=A0A9P1KCB7_9CYAN|nr:MULTISPECIES: RNA-binding protein [Limnospira]EKD11547.1 putative RNA-binding region protein [Arthrospira platensis C1]MBD2670294.1 RNA-binding protein [Arthrospira platensis FACHB-439]MDC0840381.1 RNA-binding protein [Limnoraphis robusta]MDY7053277.1 RNA-binding protein [Limnospira fusiformis LS22]QJB27692.1 RNA-binding protein [Limnospira fusiformis SAG 85.79]RAQ44140.1 RNA-binding protein [Arthrospira sp. O9.13F]